VKDDPFDTPTIKRWAQHVLDELVPNVDASAVCVTLVPRGEHNLGDVKYWVELGYMICADKPLMIVVMGDDPVPEHLERAADEIVRLPEGVNPDSTGELGERIKAFVDAHPDPG
jgi:hypothetical protein